MSNDSIRTSTSHQVQTTKKGSKVRPFVLAGAVMLALLTGGCSNLSQTDPAASATSDTSSNVTNRNQPQADNLDPALLSEMATAWAQTDDVSKKTIRQAWQQAQGDPARQEYIIRNLSQIWGPWSRPTPWPVITPAQWPAILDWCAAH
jgi:hypothetical protein